MARSLRPSFILHPPLPRLPRLHSRASCTAVAPPPAAASSVTFRLAPSDFAFLWDECKRCFYHKVNRQLFRPRAPFPSVFGNIDTAMKRHFRGLRTTDVLPQMRPGTFLCDETDAWVECLPLTPPGCQASVYIRGMVDCLVRFDDGTYGIIDFKTSQSAKASVYSRQLHAYALALESPSPNSQLMQGTVTGMGLVVFAPQDFHTPLDSRGDVSAALSGRLEYVHVKRNDEAFLKTLQEMVRVLMLPEAPDPPPPGRYGGDFSSCPYCQYLHDANKGGFLVGPE